MKMLALSYKGITVPFYSWGALKLRASMFPDLEIAIPIIKKYRRQSKN